MKLKIYKVDAFTDHVFGGNPAAVVPLNEWPEDTLLQQIAAENNLAETAFIVEEDDGWHLRWMTPKVEVNLCGHATLATAFVLKSELGFDGNEMKFRTRSGPLTVIQEEKYYVMNFPALELEPVEDFEALANALGAPLQEVYKGENYMAIFNSEEEIRNIQPDFRAVSNLQALGVIVTAPGNEVDFVSRFFAPAAGIDEDPVTGSAHCAMIPYWSEKLGKNELRALQLSERVGEIFCSDLQNGRVLLKGSAVKYLEGTIEV